MPLESLGTLVRKVATDLTVVADIQSMQFIQPVWNWLKQENRPIIQFHKYKQFTWQGLN